MSLLGVVENQLADLPGVAVTSGEREVNRNTALADLPRDVPWAGTDESGKGDYFGPLASAAVIVDAWVAEQLEARGVRDRRSSLTAAFTSSHRSFAACCRAGTISRQFLRPNSTRSTAK